MSICRSKDEHIFVLQCKHIFHRECIVEWWETLNRKSCPLCRHSTDHSIYYADSNNMDRFLVKMVACRGFRVPTIDSICKLIKELEVKYLDSFWDLFWLYKTTIGLLLTKSPEAELIFNDSISSLLSRGYIEYCEDGNIRYLP